MTIDERISRCESDIQEYQKQLDILQQQAIMLNNRSQTLVLSMRESMGALAALKEVKAGGSE